MTDNIKRPQNCGTGHCSCIECVIEPPAAPVVKLECTYGYNQCAALAIAESVTAPAAPVHRPCTICGATDHKETCDSPGAIITRSTGCPAHDQAVTPPAAQPAVPLTDEQRSKMYRAAQMRGDSIMVRSDYEQGITDAEATHGITKGRA